MLALRLRHLIHLTGELVTLEESFTVTRAKAKRLTLFKLSKRGIVDLNKKPDFFHGRRLEKTVGCSVHTYLKGVTHRITAVLGYWKVPGHASVSSPIG